jgi:hypothetical protein
VYQGGSGEGRETSRYILAFVRLVNFAILSKNDSSFFDQASDPY